MTPIAAALLLAAAGPLESVAAGDGGSTRVTVTNASVHTLPVAAGAAEGRLAPFGELGGYGSASFLAQCLLPDDEAARALVVALDRQRFSVTIPPIDFREGLPAVWIGDEARGAATLGAALEAAGIRRVLRHPVAEMPRSFSALRFAPFLVAAAPDFARLDARQRSAVEQAVAAGGTLVLATGEGGLEPDLLRRWLGVTLGGIEHPGPAARAAVPRAVTLRQLGRTPEGPAAPLVEADGLALVIESPFGLGRVRILAHALDELEPGPVAEAAFATGPDERGPLLSWLQAGAPPLGGGRSPFGAAAWGCLGALVALGLVSRRMPRFAAAGTLPLLGAALALPPGGEPLEAEAARALLLPVAEGALVFGSVDLRFGRGGAQAVAAGPMPLALEEAAPGGACLLAGETGAAFILDAEAGSAARIDYLGFVPDAPPAGGVPTTALPAGGDATLAGAPLVPVAVPVPLPLPDEAVPVRLEAFRIDVPRRVPAPPRVLPAPPADLP
ncbi:hypothetical protein L6V77_12210 [Myxococcota bacterium]|nr:hypothetical protein [Myxococcota bacterium]